MNIILSATAGQFERILDGRDNRLEIDDDVREFLMMYGHDQAIVMTGYPLRPRSFKKKILTVLLDCKGRSWAVFPGDCARCARQKKCNMQCDGVEYEAEKKVDCGVSDQEKSRNCP